MPQPHSKRQVYFYPCRFWDHIYIHPILQVWQLPLPHPHSLFYLHRLEVTLLDLPFSSARWEAIEHSINHGQDLKEGKSHIFIWFAVKIHNFKDLWVHKANKLRMDERDMTFDGNNSNLRYLHKWFFFYQLGHSGPIKQKIWSSWMKLT